MGAAGSAGGGTSAALAGAGAPDRRAEAFATGAFAVADAALDVVAARAGSVVAGAALVAFVLPSGAGAEFARLVFARLAFDPALETFDTAVFVVGATVWAVDAAVVAFGAGSAAVGADAGFVAFGAAFAAFGAVFVALGAGLAAFGAGFAAFGVAGDAIATVVEALPLGVDLEPFELALSGSAGALGPGVDSIALGAGSAVFGRRVRGRALVVIASLSPSGRPCPWRARRGELRPVAD